MTSYLTPSLRSETPSVTPVSDPQDGLEKGDLIAILDGDLASRLDEVMHRDQECDDGRSFDRSDHSRRKRAGGSYGNAICAAEAVAGMAQAGGPFNDLLLLRTPHVTFEFAEAAGAVARAATVAVGFVRDYAPLLDISADVAEQLGNFLFALAVNTIVEGQSLGDRNRIKATNIETEAPHQPTASSCPDPEESPVSTLLKVDNRCATDRSSQIAVLWDFGRGGRL